MEQISTCVTCVFIFHFKKSLSSASHHSVLSLVNKNIPFHFFYTVDCTFSHSVHTHIYIYYINIYTYNYTHTYSAPRDNNSM